MTPVIEFTNFKVRYTDNSLNITKTSIVLNMITYFVPFYITCHNFLRQDLIHEIRVTNQIMYLQPPVEDAREQLHHEMFAWEAVVTQLPRIQHSRYQVLHLSQSTSSFHVSSLYIFCVANSLHSFYMLHGKGQIPENSSESAKLLDINLHISRRICNDAREFADFLVWCTLLQHTYYSIKLITLLVVSIYLFPF